MMRRRIAIETHPEVNFSTLAVGDSAFVQNLKQYHGDILQACISQSPKGGQVLGYLVRFFEFIQKNNG
jgi:hypothetical protein